HTRNKPLADDVDIDELAEKTEGYTGADIAAVCNEAVMTAIREHINKGNGKIKKEDFKKIKVEKRHFEKALKKVKPLPKEELEKHLKVAEEFERNY
ncbi:MAG: AAA family ATPase, partial [Thermoplasmata archaeon]|nr:AAA family ATPase [Thermoplasmata archaeon]